ncbi:RNB domain-containing ribonuclease [Modestobacter roseus]|uniref:RNB domain-containing ribonuclease n=2 Tax=Modestobacter roseus TaxID=1181884 RepID=UPI001AA19E66|nr:RNB domain-containing ribonuclease [Modestobacter roseus]
MARVLKVSAPLDFAAIRAGAGVPEEFPAEVLAEADRVAADPPLPEHDATDLPLVTLDPPGARDLDQAVHLARTAGGYRVSYAIADVGAFVPLGGAIDAAARRRGQTVYSPDGRTPLHPPQLSEGAASLLPGQLRPAALWTIDLDADGEVTAVDLRRARVRSRAQLDYASVGADVPAELALLPEIGRLLQAHARDRGAIELGTPSQEVEPAPGGGWTIAFRGQSDVEGWNAQISLLTGRCAARLMLDGGVGVLRTLPPPDPGAVETLRRLAPELGVDWPDGAGPGDVIATLDPARPRHAAFLDAATSLLRGAGYTAFDGTPPDQPGHGGVGGPYAHVTAPLRRLVDRFGTEVCLALAAGEQPPAELRAALPELPGLMAASDRRTREVERAVIDLVEATVLAGRVGEVFDAVVLDADEKRSTVVLSDLAVEARCDDPLTPGQRVRVRLVTADPATRIVRFTAAGDRARAPR